MKNQKRIGLALGGGGGRGAAHIGVLTVLEEAGIAIDCVAGTSAGAVIGAAYCAGLEIPQMRDLARRMSWWDVARLVWPRRGFISFAKMEPWFEAQVGEFDVRDLSIPFAAVATDLQTGERVVLRRGRLATAVRASSSVPGVITPAEMNGRLLGDGAISDNLPVDVARELGADTVIAVDLFAPHYERSWGPLGIGFAAIETLIRRAGGGVEKADCLIAPDLSGFTYLRLSATQEFIEKGEAAARAALPQIRAALAG